MKNFHLKSILMCLSHLVCMTASAYDCCIDGVYYNLNTSDNTASVTCLYKNDRNKSAYTGSVTIPSNITYGGTYSVTSIDRYAFQYCSDLTSIAIPPSIKVIDIQAFYGCNGLSAVHITDLEAWCNISFSYASGNPLFYAHHLYLNGEEVKDLIIPEGITSIGNEAFAGGSGFTSVTIPNSVTEIGDGAFEDCSGLSSVIIPNSVISMGLAPFAACSSLTSIVVQDDNPEYDSRNNCNAIIETATNTLIMGCNQTTIPEDITSIGNYALLGCSEMNDVNIPNGIESIGDWAFAYCSGLTSLNIPNGVTSIGECAFISCKRLISIDIPNSVKSIGIEAFESCSNLTSVSIGNGLTAISRYMFSGCNNMTSITIPENVKSIGDMAFNNCTSLTSVISLNPTPPEIEKGEYSFHPDMFSYITYAKALLQVPKGCVDAYKAAEGWKNFSTIEELDEDTDVEDVKVNNSTDEKIRYNMNGLQIEEPQQGVNIIQMSDGTTKKVLINRRQ